jgi:glyoxylase I family protein
MPITRRMLIPGGSTLTTVGVSANTTFKPLDRTTKQPKERVLGFGGFFFRAKNPKLLACWYCEHLGVDETPPDYNHAYWVQQLGPTVFPPFAHDTEYFEDQKSSFMLNIRVASLTAMVAQLQSARIAVEIDPVEHSNGVFARLQDPAGNPIAIRQPKDNELALPQFTGAGRDRY